METCQQLDLPQWLVPTQADQSPAPTSNTPTVSPDEHRKLTKELLETTFEAMFERALSHIIRGGSLKSFVNEDTRLVEYEAFWRWVKRDPGRTARFKEAKELRAEWYAGRVVEIIEGVGDSAMDDVARSRLQFDGYKWLMSADDRRTYGENRHSEMAVSISVSGALEQAQARVLTMRPATIDHDTGEAVEEE